MPKPDASPTSPWAHSCVCTETLPLSQRGSPWQREQGLHQKQGTEKGAPLLNV